MEIINKNYIIKKIKDFNSKLNNLLCPDYPDLSIFSSKYYADIISKVYANEDSSNEPFAFIYGDFNRLSIINKDYGMEAGDKALEKSLSIIKNVLPENAIFSRVGGDEFTIILPGLDSAAAYTYQRLIKRALNANKHDIYNLSISIGVSDSSFGNLSEITEKCESCVRRSKYANALSDKTTTPLDIPDNISDDDNDRKEQWEKLNCLIDFTMHNHLLDIRPSKSFTFDRELLKTELVRLSKLFEELLDSKFPSSFSLPRPSCPVSEKPLTLDAQTARNIFNMNAKGDYSYLDTLDYEDLEKLHELLVSLGKGLVIHDGTNMLSSTYFKQFLIDKICSSGDEYVGLCLSSSGVRLSNSAYGHEFTDWRLEETSESIANYFREHYPDYNEVYYGGLSPIILVDRNGGNYLALFKQTPDMEDIDINELSRIINEGYDINDSYCNFNISVTKSILDTSSHEALEASINALSEECNHNKNHFKQSALCSSTNEIAFRNSVSYLISYYRDNIPEHENPENERIFALNVFTSLMYNELEYNKSAIELAEVQELSGVIDSSLDTLGLKNNDSSHEER